MPTRTAPFYAPTNAHPRDRYSISTAPIDNGPGVSNSLRVTVVELGDEQQPARVVTTYVRGLHSMYSTFEPFRQLRDGLWHDYALISADYTHLSVLDLVSGTVIADEEPPAEHVEHAAALIAEQPSRYADADAADVARSWGFCPTGFFVPDPCDHYGEWGQAGEFGVYSGCQWGDDSSWKVRYVDLSRIREGIVTCDERFGYLELASGEPLSDVVHYWPDSDRLTIATQVHFTRSTGRADTHTRDDINWDDDHP